MPGLPDIANVLYVEGLRVNLLSISEICDQEFMVLFSKGKYLVLNEFANNLYVGFVLCIIAMVLFQMLKEFVIAFGCQMKIYGTKR